MEFSLLGPVSVRSDGRNILARSRPQLRKVLAALLVDAGRLVTVEALIWRVWGSDPPENARRTLHSHISRIRRIVRTSASNDGGNALLRRHDGGYLLQADRASVDAHCFQHMVRRSSRCDAEQRADLLEDALGLWQGEPLAGLEGDWIEHRRERYRRMYVDASVSWAKSLVQSGRPHAAVDTLTGLAEQNPLAEPVVAALMHSLYASGYTADALARFHRLREDLVDELGTDPGHEIQELHTAILAGDLRQVSDPGQRHGESSRTRLNLPATGVSRVLDRAGWT
ncbi:BTAD domain-containing putative transcriptional regulator [Nocardiopsis sp. SBT366]|uniref:AfsR/SARP family transcriptional regulator n=1 Tax=Nocardiopsis sp. SBT366 TaxID=1580529 RepID=UPI00066AEB98|nr:BTAD domain-containing putative transcriptional regulator [Nocardiopsis sp. SBT366]